MKIIKAKINNEKFRNFIDNNFMGVIFLEDGINVRLDMVELETPYRLVERSFINAIAYDRLQDEVLEVKDRNIDSDGEIRDVDNLINELGELVDDRF